ncbi:Present in the outer mitochondrial membrane proteome 41 [Trypanosoma cruzi]|uniref:Present in the outer mitochondrial membrane proteome 41 n=1 Tax=Trypanosoma cruzi TaxID=5693 RepID=A0A7J6YBZ1_TRYCR|nr:Present in the outer mitochondrial membrane proteome 41 [Trypanosoma cruzi]
MSYQLYLHRSFDIQLSPVAAAIIDWAPTRRDGQVSSDVSSDLSSSGESTNTMGNRKGSKPARDGENEDKMGKSMSRSHAVESPYATGSSETVSLEATQKAHGPTGASMPDGGPREVRSSQKRMYPWLGQRRLFLLNSYAVVPLVARGSLSLNAGLFAGFGVTGGASSPASSIGTSCVSPSTGRASIYASDVLQLECIWGRMQWAGVFNVVCFSWPSASLPLCEFIGMTPRTDWSMQADRLLFNWSGFCRVFVRRGRHSRRDSLISLNSPAESALSSHGDLNTAQLCAAKNNPPPTPPATLTSRGDTAISGQDEHHAHPRAVKNPHRTERPKAAADNNDDNNNKTNNKNNHHHLTDDDETPNDSDGGQISKRRKSRDTTALSHLARKSSQTTAHGREGHRWWRLEELRCGAGLAVKNDLASGVNLYCGCSAHFGRALTVSTHVDVLRRACCSITSTTSSLDLAARLRMNLITWHRTELDFGVGWRPFKQVSGLTCRLSHSMGRTSVGITIKDVGTQYKLLRCSRCTKRGEHEELQEQEGRSWPWRRRDSHDDSISQENVGGTASVPTSSTKWSLSDWYDPYVGWVWRLGGSIFSSDSLSSSTTAASPAEGVAAHAPGLRKRLSQAMRAGLDYADALSRQTEFDLTLGLAEERNYSRKPRCFVVLSAH